MLKLDVLKQIDKRVDEDQFLEETKKMAELAHQENITDNQIRGLQNVVNATTRFSEIKNLVKSRTARHTEWKKLGPKVIDFLDQLDQDAREIANKTGVSEQVGEIRLRLCRYWVKILVAEYLYEQALSKEGRK